METMVSLGHAEELDEDVFAIRFYRTGVVLRLREDLPTLPVTRRTKR